MAVDISANVGMSVDYCLSFVTYQTRSSACTAKLKKSSIFRSEINTATFTFPITVASRFKAFWASYLFRWVRSLVAITLLLLNFAAQIIGAVNLFIVLCHQLITCILLCITFRSDIAVLWNHFTTRSIRRIKLVWMLCRTWLSAKSWVPFSIVMMKCATFSLYKLIYCKSVL